MVHIHEIYKNGYLSTTFRRQSVREAITDKASIRKNRKSLTRKCKMKLMFIKITLIPAYVFTTK